ncbi:hypothetical protein [Streptomyces sp. NPDC002580]|uniref:hypothetical protein n=1 Tax=Streptomyces sp. NPDC002580 TaxID=3364653 RepID=UPI00369AB05E
MENCPGCVTAATEARFFCRQCGTPVQAQAQALTTSSPTPQPAPSPPATAPTLAVAPASPAAPAAPVDAPAPVATPPQPTAPTLETPASAAPTLVIPESAAPTLAAPKFTPPVLVAQQFTPASAATPPASARKQLWAAGGVAGVVAAALVAGYLLVNGGTTGSVRTPDTNARADAASPSVVPEASTLRDGDDAYADDNAAGSDDTASPEGTPEWVLDASSSIQPGHLITPTSAHSGCVVGKKPDGFGHAVYNYADNTIDGQRTTAWRCNRETGRLSIELDGPTRLTKAGLIPGYTKTDPRLGTNWFGENLTVTKAVWTFYRDGQVVGRCTEVIAYPEEAMEWVSLPSAVTADSATLDVIETNPPSDYDMDPSDDHEWIAISEIGLAADNL